MKNNVIQLRRWTEKEDELLERFFRFGHSDAEIAKRIGRRDIEVFKRLISKGLKRPVTEKNLPGA